MSKRIWLPVLLILALLLPGAAQAGYPPTTEAEWNKTVKYRTTTATTLYSVSYRDGKTSWGPGESMEDDAIFTPIGTLPAGKYVNVISYEMAGKREVFYWNGGRRSAWIDENAYVRDTVTITSTDGRKTSIPRNAYGDAAAVRYILSEFLSDDEVQAYIDGMRGYSGSTGSTGSSGSSGGSGSSGSTGGKMSAKKTAAPTLPVITLTTTQTEGEDDGKETTAEVKLVQAGRFHSVVTLGDEELTVPTSALSWERDGAEHALAVVYAPKTGTATLWAAQRADRALTKLKAGSVVLVLGKSEKYTKVLGNGKVGYVITSALTLCDPAEEGREAQLTAKTKLRLEPNAKQRVLKTLPAETTVTVLYVWNEWACVEVEGRVGYLLNEALAE